MSQSRADLWPLAIVALAVVSLGVPLLWLSGYELATQYEDDAFYYFQIASNVAHGRGFTFDGLHETNGFHPLWLALLVPVFRFVPGLDAPLRVAGLLETLLLGGAGALVYAVMRRHAPRWTALLAGVLVFALPGTRNMTRVGLESALCMCSIAAVWHASQAPTSARAYLRLGVCCALAALARLEASCALLCAAWLLRTQLTAAPRRFALLLGPTLLALGAYFAWNQTHFGVPVPVSGLVKQLWAADNLDLPFARYLPLAAVLLTAAVALLRGASLTRHVPWLPLPVFTACAILSLDFASLGHLEHWYLGVAVLAAAPVLANLLRASRTWSCIALALCAGLAVARGPVTIRSVRSVQYQAELRGEAADWLRRHLPPGTRVGAWSGGMLGYYSGQDIVMLDGLANSVAFYRRALVGGDLSGYLRDEHIDHLVTAGCELNAVLATDLTVDPEQRIARSYERRAATTERALADPCAALQLWVRRP